jgi:hypothetical protein
MNCSDILMFSMCEALVLIEARCHGVFLIKH